MEPRQAADLSPDALIKETHGLLRRALLEAHPPVLYHYTSPQALIDILDSRALFATHARYLNDKSELQYAHNVVRAGIEEGMSGSKPEAQELFLSAADSLFVGDTLPSAYVTSLSAEGDLLSQWRAYCDRGRGFALGFQSDRLQRVSAEVNICRVIYDASEQHRLVVSIVAFVRPVLEAALLSGDTSRLAALKNVIWLPFGVLRAAFKHPAFAEEREYRNIVFAPGTKIRYRAAPRGVVPHVAVELAGEGALLPLSKIVVGPCLEFETQRASVSSLIRDLGYGSNVEISRSEAPFTGE